MIEAQRKTARQARERLLLRASTTQGVAVPDIVPPVPQEAAPPTPTEFEVIYADPPWRYDNGTPGREIERHYPTMTHEEICALDVPAARNAVLFLWGVAPKLPEALEVMAAWGFTYRTGRRVTCSGVWHDRQD